MQVTPGVLGEGQWDIGDPWGRGGGGQWDAGVLFGLYSRHDNTRWLEASVVGKINKGD